MQQQGYKRFNKLEMVHCCVPLLDPPCDSATTISDWSRLKASLLFVQYNFLSLWPDCGSIRTLLSWSTLIYSWIRLVVTLVLLQFPLPKKHEPLRFYFHTQAPSPEGNNLGRIKFEYNWMFDAKHASKLIIESSKAFRVLTKHTVGSMPNN